MDIKKLQKKIGDEDAAAIDAMELPELKFKLCQLAKDERETIDAMDADEGLAAAKEQAKQLAAPYTDALKSIKDRRLYIAETLKTRGAK